MFSSNLNAGRIINIEDARTPDVDLQHHSTERPMMPLACLVEVKRGHRSSNKQSVTPDPWVDLCPRRGIAPRGGVKLFGERLPRLSHVDITQRSKHQA